MSTNFKALAFFAAAADSADKAKVERFFPRMVRSAAVMSLRVARRYVGR